MPIRGPYTFDELKDVLYSAADPAYLDPFFEGAYGNGRELFEAFLTVLQRVDEAINYSTQALYITEWSGETGQPAMGEARTVLSMEFSRDIGNLAMPMTLKAGAVLYEEQTTDYSANGGVTVYTGRTYTLISDLCFLPGQRGPLTANVVATRVGYGFGNVQPGDVSYVPQPGVTFTNGGATINSPQPASPYDRMLQPFLADAIGAEQIGQYVQFVGGANTGLIRRVAGYEPDPTNATSGTAVFAREPVLQGTVTGAFQIGEIVEQYNGSALAARGRVLAFGTGATASLVLEAVYGAFSATTGSITDATGVLSGAALTVSNVENGSALVTEIETTTWEVVSWTDEFRLTVTNTAVLSQGAMGVLDAIGAERGIARSPGESDDSYRARVKAIADVVSPNAIRRIGNRIWAPYSGSVCLREIGQALFPGIYCDAKPTPQTTATAFAYDLDGIGVTGATFGTFIEGETVYQNNGGVITTGQCTTTIPSAVVGSLVPAPVADLEIANVRGLFVAGVPIVGQTSHAVCAPSGITGGLRNENRFKLNVDFAEMRAFFLLGVPPSDMGDFGIAYDDGTHNAFDANPYLAFCDGFPATAAVLNRSTWQGIDKARAGGVGYDLYVEAIGCS